MKELDDMAITERAWESEELGQDPLIAHDLMWKPATPEQIKEAQAFLRKRNRIFKNRSLGQKARWKRQREKRFIMC